MARLIDDPGLIAIGVDRSVWLDARGEDVPGPGSVPSSGPGFMCRSADPSNHSRQYGQSRTGGSVSEPFVRRPRGRVSEPSPWSWSSCTVLPGRTVGAGAPAEFALRTSALGRHAWLPTYHRAVASAHSACLSRPPERMWTDAACPRPPERRTRVHDPARNRLDRPPR